MFFSPPVMPLSTVKVGSRTLALGTLWFLRVLDPIEHPFRPLPFYFLPNDGLVTLQRHAAFWIKLLLIGNGGARRARTALAAPHASRHGAHAVCFCVSNACEDLFGWLGRTGTTEDAIAATRKSHDVAVVG